MNAEFDSTQWNKILQFLIDSLQSGQDFILKQTPIIIQELILAKRIEYSFYFGICLILILIITIGAIKLYKKHSFHDTDQFTMESSRCVIIFLSSILNTVILLICTLNIIPTFIQIWFAPNVYVLEYCNNLIRG